jgi:hypothetical protein
MICNCTLAGTKACENCTSNLSNNLEQVYKWNFLTYTDGTWNIGIKHEKPPLGIMPRYIWIEKRIEDLQRAIKEYIDAGLAIHEEWVTELNEYVNNKIK